MKRQWLIITVVAVVLSVASSVQAWGIIRGVYGPHNPTKPDTSIARPLRPDAVWTRDLTQLAEHPARVSGFWESEVGNAIMRDSNTFNYQGDAQAFTRFLTQYAQVTGIQPVLILDLERNVPAELKTKTPNLVDYDWQLTIEHTERFTSHEFSTSIHLPANGKINWRAVTMPANIQVRFRKYNLFRD